MPSPSFLWCVLLIDMKSRQNCHDWTSIGTQRSRAYDRTPGRKRPPPNFAGRAFGDTIRNNRGWAVLMKTTRTHGIPRSQILRHADNDDDGMAAGASWPHPCPAIRSMDRAVRIRLRRRVHLRCQPLRQRE